MLTGILISFGIAAGIIIALVTITLIGVSIVTFIEKNIDKIKNNLSNEKFYNTKKFSILGLSALGYTIIIAYMVYKFLFVY